MAAAAYRKDDYIFYKKSEDQHRISQKDLNRWYGNLFERGKEAGVIKSYVRSLARNLEEKDTDISQSDKIVSFIICYGVIFSTWLYESNEIVETNIS